MGLLPADLKASTESIVSDAMLAEGFLSGREMRFLALLAACPVAEGSVLEIGSFKGRSTVILAAAARIAGEESISAVDPMVAPSETDPDLKGESSSFPEFTRNLEKTGLADRVDLHRLYSYELAGSWDRRLRLLWIDGDHTYEGTKRDLSGFVGHLSDGAIVAIHDVLHEFEGGVRVFIEDILLSGHFGACGFVGSIGWAQFRSSKDDTERFRDEKLRLYRRLSKLVPFVSLGSRMTPFDKKRFKLLRSRIPHGPADPEKWIGKVEDCREP